MKAKVNILHVSSLSTVCVIPPDLGSRYCKHALCCVTVRLLPSIYGTADGTHAGLGIVRNHAVELPAGAYFHE